MKDFKSKIIITGPRASGKTHIALAMQSMFNKDECLLLDSFHYSFRVKKPKLIIVDCCAGIEHINTILNMVKTKWSDVSDISIIFQTQEVIDYPGDDFQWISFYLRVGV